MKTVDIAVIFCAPLSKFKEQPKDVSPCTIVECPSCKGQMWLSEKKKEWKRICEKINKEILMECYDCFEKRVYADPSIMQDHVQINL